MRYSLLGTLFLILLGVGSPAWATVFWDDNFTTGLANWDVSGCQNGGNPPADPFFGCNPRITNTRSNSTSYSMKTTFHPTNPSIQQATYYNRNFPPTSEVWTRQWIRFEGPNGSGSFTFDLTGTKHSIVYGNGPGFGVWMGNWFGSRSLGLALVNYPLIDQATNLYTSGTFNDYQWYCIELHINRGTAGVANGSIEVYQDGNLTLSQNGLPIESTQATCPVGSSCYPQPVQHSFSSYRHFGQYGSGDRYIDDIAVGNTRIGCTPGQGGGGSPADTTAPKTPMNLKVSWLWDLLDDAAEACANLLAWIAPAEAHATPVTVERKE